MFFSTYWSSGCGSRIGSLGEDCFRVPSRVVLLIRTLGWAAGQGGNFDRAVLTLSDGGDQIYKDPWNSALQKLADDLRKGCELGVGLRSNMRNFLPEYLLSAVERSERDGNLARTLPCYAERLDAMEKTKELFGRALRPSLLEFLVVLLLISFVSIFIVPKLSHVFRDMPGMSFSASFMALKSFPKILPYLLLLFLIVLSGLKLASVFFRELWRMSCMELMYYLPGGRAYARDSAVLELCAAMGSYLSCGENMVSAADYAADSCRYWWLRRKLKCFKRNLEAGECWLDAWHEMGLCLPVCELILRGGAMRDGVVSGFDTVSEWLRHQVDMRRRKCVCLLRFFMLLLNASLVAVVGMAIFSMFVIAIKSLLEW